MYLSKDVKKPYISLLAIFMAAIFSVSPVLAQEPKAKSRLETEAERDRVYMKIGTVTVSEKTGYLTTADVPTSVDVLGSDQIENDNVDFGMELFRKLPGTYYGDWNQGIVSGTFSIRGFDANHDVPSALIIDGIPHNWARGSMDIQPIFPMEIERIELVKGTNDPRYGLNNIAGNVNIYTRQGGNYSQVKLLHGSYQSNEGDILVARENNGFSQNYFVGYRRTDGYREHSNLEKGAASGKWFYTTSDNRLTVGAIARFFDMDADSPGYLTKEQAEIDPRQAQSFARTDGGEQENRHLSLHMDYNINKDLSWSFKIYGQHLERSRWCRWSPTGNQQERIRDEDQYGAISTLTYETAEWGIKNLKLSWGLDYQRQDNINQRYTTIDRVRQGTPFRDWDYTSWYWGTYFQADAKIISWLRLVGGLRLDRIDGDFEDKVNNNNLEMLDYGNIWQPKIGVVVTPLSGYNLYANWGRTFQIGAETMRFGQTAGGNLFERSLDYSRNDGWETGIKVSPIKWLAARLSYWEQDATDEVRLLGDGSGNYTNVGKTERDGWDLALSLRPHQWITLWGSYTKQNAKYIEPGDTLQDRKDKDVENIPENTAKAGIDFKHPCGFSSTLWWEAQDKYYVDPQNIKDKEGNYDLFNLDLRYKIKAATLAFQVRNLFDEDYNGFVWNSAYGFSPGDPRSYYGYVMLEF